MKITLKDKQNKIQRTLIMVDKSDALIFTDENGKAIAELRIENMWKPNEENSTDERNFYLTFEVLAKGCAVEHTWCSVGAYVGE